MLALVVLSAGVLVYLLDRPPGSAWLVPSAWQLGVSGQWFGPLGQWLPSLAHAFAFSVLTALCLPRRHGMIVGACAAWAAIDTLAELGQHPSVSHALAEMLARALGQGTLVVQTGRYFTQGVFDLGDVVSGLAGALAAYGVLRHMLPPLRLAQRSP
ncbi:MAG: hypothetical protein JNJ89_18665 [Rubrivivax sp.]|nr:hypothetical protein [Rubrivivax sp.]